ncbi:unnamed protein product [Soboliphyme baturini]|uniref:Beta-catenin-like protein 1 n=1 Tax=Soboliphyme baturini TaxID=241478 RepID=A0A183ILQ5_9BILA|nr:unnamed protein product [Soboliphyme baturini]
MERLDESNRTEADGVQNTLAVFENISDFRVDICSTSVVNGLMTWILKRLKTKMSFDIVRLYCSELLAALLAFQNNRELLGEIDGVDTLLQQLALYKRHNPSSSEEIEYMENLFDCLCAALLYAPNKVKFLEGEGLQLMNLMLREKKMSRASALKVLNYATMDESGRENCDKFVEILGLRTLFPLFMKSPSQVNRVNLPPEKHEEHVCSIVCSLLKSCSGQQKQRVLSKFVENDHEKVERLMELHFAYMEKVQAYENTHQRRQQMADDDLEDEYLRKLDAGLFTLQLIDYIMAEVVVFGSVSIRDRVVKILNLKGESFDSFKKVLTDYAEVIGDNDKNTPEVMAELNHIRELLSKL